MTGDQILLVEDNPRNMKLLRDVLRATGYRTLEASTGGQALTLAIEHRPAVVLIDIRLPDMDGVEALRRLRTDERTTSIAVLAVTAQAMKGDRERFRKRASTATSRSRSTSTSFLPPSRTTRGAAERPSQYRLGNHGVRIGRRSRLVCSCSSRSRSRVEPMRKRCPAT